MKHLLWAGLVVPVLGFAQSPFDGTWRAALETAKLPDRPDVYVLEKDIFECQSCLPPLRVRADGTDQTVSGHPYYDAVAVRVIDARTVEILRKKGRRLTSKERIVIAADGGSLSETFEDRTESAPITSKLRATRTAAGPAGAHRLSGAWRTTRIEQMSRNGSIITLKTTANGVSLRDANGRGYDAEFGGEPRRMIGDLAHTMVAVRRLDPRTFEQTDTRDGKAVMVTRFTIAPDGRTLEAVIEDRSAGTSTRITLRKQP